MPGGHLCRSAKINSDQCLIILTVYIYILPVAIPSHLSIYISDSNPSIVPTSTWRLRNYIDGPPYPTRRLGVDYNGLVNKNLTNDANQSPTNMPKDFTPSTAATASTNDDLDRGRDHQEAHRNVDWARIHWKPRWYRNLWMLARLWVRPERHYEAVRVKSVTRLLQQFIPTSVGRVHSQIWSDLKAFASLSVRLARCPHSMG